VEIRKAHAIHSDAVLDLVSKCLKVMKKQRLDQWDDEYPKNEVFIRDIENESLFLAVEKDHVIGIIVLTGEQEPEYEDVHWNIRHGKPLVVHRLAVHPRWRRRGIATRLMRFAEEYAMDRGYASLRIDTYVENSKMQHLIEYMGYTRCGEIFFPTHTLPFICYEKLPEHSV
jgi:GNAT superfamily N-acetyltransferase